MASGHHTGAIRKQPINRKNVFTAKEHPPVCGKSIPSYEDDLDVIKANDNKYNGVYKWNSLLKMKQEIENIEKEDKKLSLTNTDLLTPRTKRLVMPKINQKLNIGTNSCVFKNLVPLNVNDAQLLPEKHVCLKTKYKITKTNKMPVPDLADFLDPLPPLTHEVVMPKMIELEFPEFKYDMMAAYKDFFEEEI